jgi:hypothetical protein
MLRHTSEIDGYAIGATDGPIGSITDFLFDDVTWLVRWLVVDTGTFLSGRKVLLPPSALTNVNHIGRQLSVALTKQQVKDSPEINGEGPILRTRPVMAHPSLWLGPAPRFWALSCRGAAR